MQIQSLKKLSPSICKSLKGVFTDIDDTLTLNGKLPPVAYEALEILQSRDLLVIPVTGRPAGWCDHIARFWPVDGVIGENGGLYFYWDGSKLRRRYMQDEQTRKNNRKKLEFIGQEIFQKVPGSAPASDQQYREFDLAVDYCEDVPPLDADAAANIVSIFQKYGAQAKISSIHVNGWFGEFNKLIMCRIFLKEAFSIDLALKNEKFLFIGDSPNDEPMFKFFKVTVGVNNIRKFLDQMEFKPAYITNERGGYGFREMTDYIVSERFSDSADRLEAT